MRRSTHLRIRHFMYDRRNDDWTHRPIRPIDTNRKQIIMQLKNNDSFLRASLPLFLLLAAFSISLHLFLSIIVTVISNQKLQVSLPPARSVCLSDFIDRRPAVSFRQRAFHFHHPRVSLPHTLRAPSFATAVVLSSGIDPFART